MDDKTVPQFDFGRLGKPFEADWPVDVPVMQDGGYVTDERFMARFKLVSKEDMARLEDPLQTKDADRQYIREFFIGFAKSSATDFTPELLELLIDTPYVKRAINIAYQQFQLGIPAKNSPRPPA